MRQRRLFFILTFLSAFILSSCTSPFVPSISKQNKQAVADENIDKACSYFYFLWGSSAEYKGLYEEALEAYEKASLCDPTAVYIKEKIPELLIKLARNEEAISWLTDYLKQFPDKTAQRLLLARLLLLEEKEEKAIALYEDILALEPDNNTILLSLGLLYVEKNDLEKAEQFFMKILETNPQSYFANLYMARLASMKEEFQQAENYYQQARTVNTNIDLLFEIAEFYTADKQLQRALRIYQEILEIAPENERAAFNRIKIYLFLEKNDAALRELERIRNFTNDPVTLHLIEAQIYLNSNEREQAKKILETIYNEDPLDKGSYLLGLVYYQEKQFDKAITVLQDISPESVEFQDAVILQTRIRKQIQRYDEAVIYLKTLLASEVTRRPVFYSLLAQLHATENEKEKVLQVLQEGNKVYPDEESILYEYAIRLENEGLHSAAMQKMIQLIEMNSNHADALNFVGYSWADDNIKLQQALAYIKKALDIKPESGYILDSLGWVYFRLGDYKNALVYLKKSIELEENDPHIFDHLGDVYIQLGEDEMALFFYQKALEKLKKDDTLDIKIKEKIKKLEKRK